MTQNEMLIGGGFRGRLHQTMIPEQHITCCHGRTRYCLRKSPKSLSIDHVSLQSITPLVLNS